MSRALLAMGAVFVLATLGFGQVWNVDFTNGDINGVVQFQSNNPDIPAMFNPGGGLGNSMQVMIEDGKDYGGVINKGGKPLGAAAVPANQSVSAYYKFSWSQLPTSSTSYTFAGFLGDTQVHASREALGTLMIHWVDGGHYYLRTAGFFGGVGIGDAGSGPGANVDLGTNPLGAMYQLVLSWDAPTHTMKTSLYDAAGAVLASTIGDLDNASDYPNLHNLPQANLDGDLAATNLKYLGWMDYAAYLSRLPAVWDIAQVAYFDSVNGAYSLVPEPASALLLACGLGILIRRRRA